jgi:hypothetical protein
MATNTYVALAKVVSNGSSDRVTFAGIPQTYTDLRLVCSVTETGAGGDLLGYFNQNVSAIYSTTVLKGNGTAASSLRESSTSIFRPTAFETIGSVPAIVTIDILNYSNTTTFKTLLSRVSNDKGGSGITGLSISLFRSTSAISEIELGTFTAGVNFASGSTFSLYGIKAE